MISILRRLLATARLEQDPAILQALEDQKTAEYPYCADGSMACRALCDCMPGPGHLSGFVDARAQLIRDGRQDHVPTQGNIQLTPRPD